MKRRNFLKVVGGVAGGIAAGMYPEIGRAEPLAGLGANGMPMRVLGRTGLKVSVIGYSGLALRQGAQEDCNASIRQSLERGVNYLDVAPAYADGECETKLGIALQGLDRSKYFLACKTKMRDQEGCRKELERSLQRLKTDHFDVYQLHHITKASEVKQVLGPGGAMETILKAKEEGKVRFIGFSAHTTLGALAALRNFSFDTVMFPINYVEYLNRGFGKEVLAAAKEKGAAVLAIKPMHAGAPKRGENLKHQWWYRITEEQEHCNLAWRFSLSMPGVIIGFPPAWLDLAPRAARAGHAYHPITEDEMKKLRELAAGQGSIFQREEEAAAQVGRHYECPYPHRPHECDPQFWA